MLQNLFAALWNYFGRPFHVLLARLHQTTQGLLELCADISGTQLEVDCKSIAETHEPFTHCDQWAFRINVYTQRFAASLAKECAGRPADALEKASRLLTFARARVIGGFFRRAAALFLPRARAGRRRGGGRRNIADPASHHPIRSGKTGTGVLR